VVDGLTSYVGSRLALYFAFMGHSWRLALRKIHNLMPVIPNNYDFTTKFGGLWDTSLSDVASEGGKTRVF
jgi:hypothetical protein